MVRPVIKPAITSIRFKALVPGLIEPATTEFLLGDGPCGKTVRSLAVRTSGYWLLIEQVTTDGEHKTFAYKMRDIVGRVVVTRKAAEL